MADYEREAVRAGTMSFEPTWSPFDWRGAAVVGLMWAVGTVLVAARSVTAVALARWVWGKG